MNPMRPPIQALCGSTRPALRLASGLCPRRIIGTLGYGVGLPLGLASIPFVATGGPVRIDIAQTDMYRVTHQELVQAGWSARPTPVAHLALEEREFLDGATN